MEDMYCFFNAKIPEWFSSLAGEKAAQRAMESLQRLGNPANDAVATLEPAD